jgi:hypothetical protein
MDFEIFRKKMRRMGKKPHVIDGLVRSVEQFDSFLEKSKRGIPEATCEDVDNFVEELEKDKKGSSRKVIRGMALYFNSIDRPEIAKHANEIREQAISRTRRAFLLKDFLGVDEKYIQKLEEVGISNVREMINAGRNHKQRKHLAALTGIPLDVILEYVKLSDLTRIGALRRVRARLYYDVGLDTIDKIAASDPDDLRNLFVAYVAASGFNGIAPLPKELRNAVQTAKKLDRLVEY